MIFNIASVLKYSYKSTTYQKKSDSLLEATGFSVKVAAVAYAASVGSCVFRSVAGARCAATILTRWAHKNRRVPASTPQ